MRRLPIVLAAISMLVLATAAWAAHPKAGLFAGKTSLHAINGFPDLVTFRASANGRMLTRFQFGTLGCFGHGTFPLGTDPYADATAIGTIKSIPVTAKGIFTTSVKASFVEAGGIVTMATISGTFSSAKSASGTITLTQTDNGDKCGPAKMKFKAFPGTPTSLGYDGP